MRTKRIPGVKSYQSVPGGLQEAVQSPAMSSAAVAVAEEIAQRANAVGEGTFAARPAPVRGGYDNQRRAGASAYTVETHWKDTRTGTRDGVLFEVAQAMARRSPRE